MIVIDASILVLALAYRDEGTRCRARILNEELVAPHLIDPEVVSVLRKATRSGALTQQRAQQSMKDLAAVTLERFSPAPLLPRIWQLRENVSPNNACYV
ncbi:MAG: type II toxin-antitoxin system VapC family toxin, partial [Pseudonocardiaceae bacterium]